MPHLVVPEREKASCSRRGGSEKAVALTSAGYRPNPENESIKGVEYWKCHRSDWLDLDVELMLPAGVPQWTTSENLKAEVLLLQCSPPQNWPHPHPALCTAGTQHHPRLPVLYIGAISKSFDLGSQIPPQHVPSLYLCSPCPRPGPASPGLHSRSLHGLLLASGLQPCTAVPSLAEEPKESF